MRLRVPGVTLLLLLAAASAAAQRPATGSADVRVDSLATVTVTATRSAVETHRAPARVTVITRADAEAAGAETVADLLEARSAVFLKRYGPDGLATVSLRGGSASHTLVTLDGHRLSDPQLGQLDLSLLPAALVERAEVLHGAASGLYGTDAVGGVVALSAPAGETRARAVIRSGAFGERGASGLATALIGPTTTATVALDAAHALGTYAYVDSTAFDTETGTNGVTRLRANADRQQEAAYARIGGTLGRNRWGFGLLGTRAETGIFDYGGGTDARQNDAALRLWLDHTLALGSVAVTTGADLQRASLRYRHAGLGLDDTGHTRVASVQTRAERIWVGSGRTLTASIGGRVGRATAEHPNLAEDARETSVALDAGAVLDAGRVLVAPSLRFDRASVPVDSMPSVQALSPQLGLNVQPFRWRGLRLKASAGRAFRAPTFNDRFWQPGGNAGLRPERGWTAEAGASLVVSPDLPSGLARLTAEATLFTSRLRDQIVWRPGRHPDGFYWAPLNVGRTRTVGWELSGRAGLPLAGRLVVDVGALWAHSAARDRTDSTSTSYDQPLIYVPDDQVKLDAALAWRGLRVGADVRHVSARPTSTDGSRALPPFTVVGAHVEAGLSGQTWRARLGLHAENLTDAVYSVTPRSPMPPRHLRAVLTLESR